MAKRTYRSANGKAIDMDTLSLKNETVIAVGNMSCLLYTSPSPRD